MNLGVVCMVILTAAMLILPGAAWMLSITACRLSSFREGVLRGAPSSFSSLGLSSFGKHAILALEIWKTCFFVFGKYPV